jgi:hypothetical protein
MKKHLLALLLCGILFPLTGNAQDWKVLFSANGGFYDDVLALEMFSTYPQGRIFYTVNGNRPTVESEPYTEPLVLDESFYSKSDIYTIQISSEDLFYLPDSVQHCIVIRAAAFDENDSCISAITTQSYFIRTLGCDTHGLSVVSLCADSLDLFDYERGIMVPGIHFDSLFPETTGNYFQKGREWERLVNVEYYDIVDNGGINQLCGLRTHGNRSRRQPQKGLKIYAREEYGKKRFKHRFFEESLIDSFKHLLIKPYSTLYPYTGIQDYICSRMAVGLGLEAGCSRPICLYINGEYWGIYFLQEKMDERYLEDHLNIDIEQCNIISNWGEVECGNPQGFNDMMEWLETANLSIEEDYDYISNLVDIDNFIDYMILETFVANLDWPANNNRCWQVEDGPWRWMFFDGDAAFNSQTVDSLGNPTELDVFGNATYTGENTWPSSRRATLLFRRLLENQDFFAKFNQRIHDLCQTAFLYENTSPLFFHICDLLRPEIPEQSFRFGKPSSPEFWNWACTLTDNFLKNRVNSYLAEWETYIIVDVPEHFTAFRCYPNPSSGEIHLHFDAETFSADEIVIYNLMGQKVFSMPILCLSGANEITLHPDLAPGIYLLNLGGQTHRIVRY